MAIVHNNLTVGTTASIIAQVPTGVKTTSVIIYNNDSSAIFVGDAQITSTAGSNQGLPIPRSSSQQLWLSAGDILYGISAGGTSNGAVTVLYTGI